MEQQPDLNTNQEEADKTEETPATWNPTAGDDSINPNEADWHDRVHNQ
jgi:hypothetical protein